MGLWRNCKGRLYSKKQHPLLFPLPPKKTCPIPNSLFEKHKHSNIPFSTLSRLGFFLLFFLRKETMSLIDQNAPSKCTIKMDHQDGSSRWNHQDGFALSQFFLCQIEASVFKNGDPWDSWRSYSHSHQKRKTGLTMFQKNRGNDQKREIHDPQKIGLIA